MILIEGHGLNLPVEDSKKWEISGFRRDINGIFALLGCYAAYIGSYRRFGTTLRSLLQREPWNGTENIGVTIEAPIDRVPETSVTTTAIYVTLRAGIVEYGTRRLYRKNLRCVTSQKNEDLQWWALVNTVMNLRVPWHGWTSGPAEELGTHLLKDSDSCR